MTVGRKIIGGYVIVLLLLVLVAAVAMYALRSIHGSYTAFLDVDIPPVLGALRLETQVEEQIALYRGLILFPDQRERLETAWRASHRRFDALLEDVRRRSRTEEGVRMLNEIGGFHARLEATQEKGVRYAAQGNAAAALALQSEIVPLIQVVRRAVDQYVARQQQQLAGGRKAVAIGLSRTQMQLIAISLFAIVLGIVIGAILSRTITLQLRETIAQLSASSAEILATTSQVAAGAAETAASVSETTATVEEVKQTAQLSSQKAKFVSDSSQKAASVSETGIGGVQGTIEGMQRIQQQMESIAETIVRLSEQGRSARSSPPSAISPSGRTSWP